MDFCISGASCLTSFIYDRETYPGVVRIAGKVAEDVKRICGRLPENICTDLNDINALSADYAIIYGTVGHSSILGELNLRKKIDISVYENKEEIFGFYLLEHPYPGIKYALVIAGSDKRGTIYGLFHLSHLMGVSPFVDWSDVRPLKRDTIVLKDPAPFISKEPSVRYRGFFINDEYPAFATWVMRHFGGYTAEMYEHIFELLLRLRGNCLWPAMWTSSFSDDGPGLKNAELADEYGIIMGTSPCEPCMRQGVEFGKLKGEESAYGSTWDFSKNRKGMISFWEDGLKRNAPFEKIITLGLRGRNDLPALNKDSSLKDNIDLLKDVISTQHELIRNNVDSDLAKVKRVFPLYKEVEDFYYGDKDTDGLISFNELDDVILLLSDDDNGYLRSVPNGAMREHKGGFGLYYHFDHHGEPISYEWTNSTYLPIVHNELTTAYENGVKELWMVNAGDIAFQEFPLSYFMDMAYDYEKWGIGALNSTEDYTKQWVDEQFLGKIPDESLSVISRTLTDFSRISHSNRPEHLNEKSYSPAFAGRSKKLLDRINACIADMDAIRDQFDEGDRAAFCELIYYNVVATLNIHRIWIYTAWNHYFSKAGALVANKCGEAMIKYIRYDRSLSTEFSSINNSRWDGFALARHLGFKHWNDEEMCMPTIHTVLPVYNDKIIVGVPDREDFTCGGDWTGHAIESTSMNFYIASGSSIPVPFEISLEEVNPLTDDPTLEPFKGIRNLFETHVDPLEVSEPKGVVTPENNFKMITVRVNQKIDGKAGIIAHVRAGSADAKVHIREVDKRLLESDIPYAGVKLYGSLESNGFSYAERSVTIPADKFSTNKNAVLSKSFLGREVKEGGFKVLNDIGIDTGGIKAFPITADWPGLKEPPYVEYKFIADHAGQYRLKFVMKPSNPIYRGNSISIRYSIDSADPVTSQILSDDYKPGVMGGQWADGVISHTHSYTTGFNAIEGENTIRFYAHSPEVVLEKLILSW